MKATIHDPDAIRIIRPFDVTAYLRQSQWTEQSQDGSRAIWTHEDYEVLVPLNSNYRDYPVRMTELLETLSIAENRSQLEIFEDLTMSGADIVRLRLIDSEVEAGSLPLEEAALMGARAKELMSAAACAVKSPKPVYGPRRPEEANEYVRSVRMGQTEHGSFVLKLLSPVPPRLRHEHPSNSQSELEGIPREPQEEPFARKVTLQLAKAVNAMHTAALCAAGSGNITAFEKAVSSGVSANLCDAVTGLASPADLDRKLEISISWALSRPLLEPLETRVMFTPDTFPIISEAARMFRDSTPRDGYDIIGPVIKCHRDEGAEIGHVIIHAPVEEHMRLVRISLETSEYNKAVESHMQEKVIHYSGTLVKEGKGYRLTHPSYIEMGEE